MDGSLYVRSEVNCPECGTHCGWWYEYVWGPNGCDPPEYVGEDNYMDADGVVYCSERCLEENNERAN